MLVFQWGKPLARFMLDVGQGDDLVTGVEPWGAPLGFCLCCSRLR
jgi:hypothetical protein